MAWLWVSIIVSSSCTSAPRYPAQGALFGQPVSTTVDSEIARYALEGGPALSPRAGSALDARIAGVRSHADGNDLDWELLKWIADRTSPDYATLYLLGRVQRNAAYARLQARFQREFDCVRARSGCVTAAEGERLRALRGKYRILAIGGFHYKSDPSTGADLAQQRKVLRQNGYDTELVDLDEDGIVEENAALIAGTILRQPTGKSLILVSASKGGPEAAYALGKILKGQDLDRVRAWVSIGGILRGTLVADDAVRFPNWWIAKAVLFVLGIDSKGVPSMTVAVRRARYAELSLPPHLLMIQYIGAPLSGQVPEDVRGRYDSLRAYGPNDGMTLLADELVAGGFPIVEPGLDHFFRDPDIDLRTLAMANLVVAELNP
jgi:hypothetical protein